MSYDIVVFFRFSSYLSIALNLVALLVWFMVFNATFNNILAMLSVLLVEETGVPGKNHQTVTDKLYPIMLYRVYLTTNEVRTQL